LIEFFFSSRRRHTRSYGDWSSDVCSSDLRERTGAGGALPDHHRRRRTQSHAPHPLLRKGPETVPLIQAALNRSTSCPTTMPFSRSEERRVGKECRTRGWRES